MSLKDLAEAGNMRFPHVLFSFFICKREKSLDM